MEDAADLALSDEAVKPEPSVADQPQPSWKNPARPQQAYESQFQINMPPNPFPPAPAAPPQSASCSGGAIANYCNPNDQLPNSQRSEAQSSPLQDYQTQLMLLEKHKKRLESTRQEQDSIALPTEQEEQKPYKAKPINAQTCCYAVDMVAEQQNKERLLKARREQDAMPIPRGRENQGPAQVIGHHALVDHQMQLMLLEQQNKKRLMLARQEQVNKERDSNTTPSKQEASFLDPNKPPFDSKKQDYQTQLRMLEQQNKKRLMMARQEQADYGRDSQITPPKQESQPSSSEKQDYEMQLRLLEQQNKKRLMMVRQEQEAMAVPPKQGGNLPFGMTDAEYQKQLELLEACGRKRLAQARREQHMPLGLRHDPMDQQPEQPNEILGPKEASRQHDHQQTPSDNSPKTQNDPPKLPELQVRLTALEQYNKKRLALARKEHSGSPLPAEQRAKLLEAWESDYHRQLQNAPKPGEKAGHQDKRSDTGVVEWEREILEAINPPPAPAPQQQPHFVDWEAQARAHIGVGPKDALNPENQKKVDDIIKQKYQQVWGVSDKEGNGQKASDAPVIQTYQEQLRAKKMTQPPIMTPQQKLILQQKIQRLKQGGPMLFPKRQVMANQEQQQQVANSSTSQDGSPVQQQASTSSSNNTVAREGYENELWHLKQENSLRQQQLAYSIAQQQRTIGQQNEVIKQMQLLEQQNKKRLSMAEAETQSRKRMMMAPTPENKGHKQPGVAQPDKTSNNTTASGPTVSGNCCCGINTRRCLYCIQAGNSEYPVKRVSDYAASSRGHCLQDYQTQLMLLEEQNRVNAGQKMEKDTQATAAAQNQAAHQRAQAEALAKIQALELWQQQQRRQVLSQQSVQRAAQLQVSEPQRQLPTSESMLMLGRKPKKEQCASNPPFDNPHWMLEAPMFLGTRAAGLSPGSDPNSKPSQPFGGNGSYFSQSAISGMPQPRYCDGGDPNFVQPLRSPSSIPPSPVPGAAAPRNKNAVRNDHPSSILPYPGPSIQQNENAGLGAPAKEDMYYAAGTEASEDSDWSRLSTPIEDEDFVLVENVVVEHVEHVEQVEHGALPIRSAHPEEQS